MAEIVEAKALAVEMVVVVVAVREAEAIHLKAAEGAIAVVAETVVVEPAPEVVSGDLLPKGAAAGEEVVTGASEVVGEDAGRWVEEEDQAEANKPQHFLFTGQHIPPPDGHGTNSW